MTSSTTVTDNAAGVIDIDGGDVGITEMRVVTSMSGDEVSRIGRYWQSVHGDRWRDLPSGATVVFNVETGASVTSDTGVGAVQLFEKMLGTAAIGWSFDVGRPATAGVGVRS